MRPAQRREAEVSAKIGGQSLKYSKVFFSWIGRRKKRSDWISRKQWGYGRFGENNDLLHTFFLSSHKYFTFYRLVDGLLILLRQPIYNTDV